MLPFLNRKEEQNRLEKLIRRPEGSLAVLYGRRRCGKSRLIHEVLPKGRSVYYVGDDRERALQRAGLASEIARLIPGFDRVTYPEWDALFARWWDETKPGMVLALDEFPALVSAAKEIPSLLQKHFDHKQSRGAHLILAGSSQSMMQGLVLDRTAPLFGRASEILNISPLPAGWIQRALKVKDPVEAVEAYSVWGGVPRYWELAAEHPNLDSALQDIVLSPLGALYEEPTRILLDDMRDMTQVNSILSLIGRGCHRSSEIAGRLRKPATSLSRPLQRLVELGLIRRISPFGISPRQSKRTTYQISDPFLLFWFRVVEPNRSQLEARQTKTVALDIRRSFPHHIGGIWEELARESVPRIEIWNRTWRPASRWWGTNLDREQMEIDIVAESSDGRSVLLGEAKWSDKANPASLLRELQQKAESAPFVRGRKVYFALWLKQSATAPKEAKVLRPRDVLRSLR